MKQIALSILFVIFFATASGQTPEKLFSVKDTIIGKSIVTEQPILAKKYESINKIKRWYWDGGSDNLLLELKIPNNDIKSRNNDALLTMFDLNSKQVKWTRQINSNLTEVRLWGYYYFLSINKTNRRINPETGKTLWTHRNEFYFINPNLNIGIGYPLLSMSDRLSAVNLSTGKELWKTKVYRAGGWDDAHLLNDSTLVISAEGIRAVNLTNGASWTHKVKTTKNEIGKMMGVNAVGIILGILTGVTVYQAVPDMISNMVSNMLIDSQENIFLASRDYIFKIDRSGKRIWTTALPKKQSSSSSIFQIDSIVYLINKGHGKFNNEFSIIGSPYFAAFNSENGKRLFSTPISEKDDFIHTFQAVNNRLFLVFKNKIIAYSLSDGSIITEKSPVLQEEELLDQFVGSGVYRKESENRFVELGNYFSDYNLMMTSNGRVFVLTDNLETLYTYDKSDLYHEKIENANFRLISNNSSDYKVLDNSGSQIATLKTSAEMFLHNNRLVFIDKNAFWETDLSAVYQITPKTVWHGILENVSKQLSFESK